MMPCLQAAQPVQLPTTTSLYGLLRSLDQTVRVDRVSCLLALSTLLSTLLTHLTRDGPLPADTIQSALDEA